MKISDLCCEWFFRRVGREEWLPAAVPGNIFLDLYRAGLIPDPYYRDHEKAVQWVGYEDWEYRACFQVPDDLFESERIDLCFDGLDTLATVTLNGRAILTAENMFRIWRVAVKEHLNHGDNELLILFRSPIRHILLRMAELQVQYPAVNDVGEQTSPHVRKAPYQFGWDWAPRLVGCGVWKPVRLEAWSTARIESLQIITTGLTSDEAYIAVNVEIEAAAECEADLVLQINDGAFMQKRRRVQLLPGRQILAFDCRIENPKYWCTHDRGDAHLYSLTALVEFRGRVLDEKSSRFGLRRLELVQKPDDAGAGFTFFLNGEPLFIKGANWIPADCFPTRVTREKYRELLLACREAGMNMVRVWGGGIYEADDFYELCDELGLLVWQEFMFSCALYPAQNAFWENVKPEAVDQIKRLRNHPCIALWCGNNEIEMGWNNFGWRERLPAAMFLQNEVLFRELLAETVAFHDPTRPYWPSSPSSNGRADANSPYFGDMHYWDVWHKSAPFETYLEQQPRFMSEFGFQSFPLLETVKTFAEAQDFDIESPVMLLHQKNPHGNRLIRDYLLQYFPPAKDFPSFLYLSQIQQAEAIRTAAEHLRRIRPRCMGALYWQLNDCWPVASWSSIDYTGRWKALHYAAKRFFAPVLVSPLLTPEEVQVHIVSDLNEPIAATLLLELITFDGRLLRRERRPVFAAPCSAGLYAVIPRSEIDKIDPGETLLFCSLEGYAAENVLYFAKPKEFRLPRPEISLSVAKSADGFELTLSADRLHYAVCLSVQDAQGRFSDNFFDLVPNRPRRVTFSGGKHLTLRELQDRLSILSLADAAAADGRSDDPFEKLALVEKEGLSLHIEKEGVVLFESRDPMLKPLFTCLTARRDQLAGAVMVDKIVGLAAAMLAVLGGVSRIITPTASESAKQYLQQAGIPLFARRVIPHIVNREGTDLCPMEKLANACSSAEELFEKLKKMIR